MIKFEHNGLQISCQKACYRGYDDANVPKWNLEGEPFVVQWIVQKDGDMLMLGMVKDCMSHWGIVGKGRCCYWFALKLQQGKDIGWPWT